MLDLLLWWLPSFSGGVPVPDTSVGLGLGVTGTASAATVATLTPDGTVTAGAWTAVGAATRHQALAEGDGDYIQCIINGGTTRVTLSNPAVPLTLTAATLRIRARKP